MNIQIENKDYLEFLATIPDGSVDFVCIDPPYGVLKGHKIETKIDIPSLTSEVNRILKKDGFYAFFGQEPTIKEFEIPAYQKFNYKQEIIWCKRDAPLSIRINKVHEKIMIFCKGSSDFFNYRAPYADIKIPETLFGLYNIESVFRELSFWKSKAKGNNPSDGKSRNKNKKKNDDYYSFFNQMSDGASFGKEDIKLNTIWSFLPENKVNKNSNNTQHPTVKPIKLLNRLIELCTPENAVVVDCFVGSGTTAIACKNTNRNFKGCELYPEYYQISLQRLKDTQDILFYSC